MVALATIDTLVGGPIMAFWGLVAPPLTRYVTDLLFDFLFHLRMGLLVTNMLFDFPFHLRMGVHVIDLSFDFFFFHLWMGLHVTNMMFDFFFHLRLGLHITDLLQLFSFVSNLVWVFIYMLLFWFEILYSDVLLFFRKLRCITRVCLDSIFLWIIYCFSYLDLFFFPCYEFVVWHIFHLQVLHKFF